MKNKVVMRIIRKPELCRKTGKSYPSIWRDIKAGDFPRPVQIGVNSIGWYEHEIDEYLASLPRVISSSADQRIG